MEIPAALFLKGKVQEPLSWPWYAKKAKQAGIAGRIKLQVMNFPAVDTPPACKGLFYYKGRCFICAGDICDFTDFNNSDVAPILAKDLSYLPPAEIMTAEFDPLRDQGAVYAEKLRKAGVKVWYKCFASQIHVLLSAQDDAPASKEADEMVLTAMKEVLYGKRN